MRIELEEPFKNDYKAGYLNINKEPRRLVLLVDFENKKTSISYARYLYSVKENRYLDKSEQVDHIDGDKLNDSVDNLQILTQQENNVKSVKQNNKSAKTITFVCPICGKTFVKMAHNYNYRPTFVPSCSRECANIKKRNIK